VTRFEGCEEVNRDEVMWVWRMGGCEDFVSYERNLYSLCSIILMQ